MITIHCYSQSFDCLFFDKKKKECLTNLSEWQIESISNPDVETRKKNFQKKKRKCQLVWQYLTFTVDQIWLVLFIILFQQEETWTTVLSFPFSIRLITFTWIYPRKLSLFLFFIFTTSCHKSVHLATQYYLTCTANVGFYRQVKVMTFATVSYILETQITYTHTVLSTSYFNSFLFLRAASIFFSLSLYSGQKIKM